jgi:hypothetical protein
MNKSAPLYFLRPIIIFFILINAFCLTCGAWLDKKGVDHFVLIYANLILFMLTSITSFIHIKAIKNNNPYSFVRAVTVASFLKLIVIAVSVAIYFIYSEKRSLYAIAVAMLLYIVYTIFEVKGAMRINRERNAKN